MEKPNIFQIEGTTYLAQINDDRDCPVSISRVYETGERRTRFIGLARVTQVKQVDGSWKVIKKIGWR